MASSFPIPLFITTVTKYSTDVCGSIVSEISMYLSPVLFSIVYPLFSANCVPFLCTERIDTLFEILSWIITLLAVLSPLFWTVILYVISSPTLTYVPLFSE